MQRKGMKILEECLENLDVNDLSNIQRIGVSDIVRLLKTGFNVEREEELYLGEFAAKQEVDNLRPVKKVSFQ